MKITNIVTILTLLSILFIITIKSIVTISYINEGFYFLIAGMVSLPILFLFLLFPVYFLISNITLLFIPKSYWNKSSEYFIPKLDISKITQNLPHFTIQVPIYDEDFKKLALQDARNCNLKSLGIVEGFGCFKGVFTYNAIVLFAIIAVLYYFLKK